MKTLALTLMTSIVLSGLAFGNSESLPTRSDHKPPSEDEDKDNDELSATLKWLKKLDEKKFGDWEIEDLRSIKKLELHRYKIADDKEFKHLRYLTSLNHLDLRRTIIGDQGLKELRSLTSLHHLDLRRTKITNQGLKELRPLTSLVVLNVRGTKITDQGLKELGSFDSFRKLDLTDTNITAQGLIEVKEALPNTNFQHSKF